MCEHDDLASKNSYKLIGNSETAGNKISYKIGWFWGQLD